MSQKSIISQRDVRARYRNCSKATLYKHVKDGLFPLPIKLSSRMSGWLSDDLDEFFADPIAWRTKHVRVDKDSVGLS